MRKQFFQNLVVGIFVAAVLAYGMYFIYQTSEEGSMLLDKFEVETTMDNANGIKRYASVRIHGIPVGKIESVKFSQDPGETTIYIDASISDKYLGLVAISNPDPEAPPNDPEGIFGYFYINSEGLLGDNLLDIYAGNPELAPEAAKRSVRGWARREVKEDWAEMEKEWDEDTAQTEIQLKYEELLETVGNLDKGYVTDESFLRTKSGGGGLAAITESLDPTLARVNDLLDAAKTEPGLLNTLFYDPKGKELVHHLDDTVVNVRDILGDVKEGPGGLHEVIYGDQVASVLNDLKGAMGDVKGVTGDVQAVIADVKQRDIIGNVKGTVVNVEDITKKINEGEGTLGMLVTDKSLYQDLQELLGGAKRSTVVKEAIRYVKKRNKEQEEKAMSKTPE